MYTIFKNLTIILIVCLISYIRDVVSLFLGIWRSHLVWWQSDSFDFHFVYLHGMQAQQSTTSQIN